MNTNATRPREDADREMPLHSDTAEDQSAPKKPFTAPLLTSAGAFAQVTTQFIGSFDP